MRIRLIVPDSHGCFIDKQAERAFLKDARYIDADEIIFLGDHVDASSIYSTHPRNYVEDLAYSYEEDISATDLFLSAIERACPKAFRRGQVDYIEGNHEQHIERWISRNLTHKKDADAFRLLLAPQHRLRLKSRGINYFPMDGFYDRLPFRGTIKRGKCLFAHGYRANKFATASMLDDIGYNIVHGHTHRAQTIVKRTIRGEIGGWCPGTLAQLQPLYQHTAVSGHSHGYAIQVVENSGKFCHINIPIVNGESMLKSLIRRIK